MRYAFFAALYLGVFITNHPLNYEILVLLQAEMAYIAFKVLVYENCGVGDAAVCPGYIKVIHFWELCWTYMFPLMPRQCVFNCASYLQQRERQNAKTGVD